MNNSPELDGKYLGTITKDFVQIADTLKEASYQIRRQKISEHPIFVMAKIDAPIGKLLFEKGEIAPTHWNYYASFLAEFVQRQLIIEEGIKAFEQTYKNPDEFCCLFVLDEQFTNFVFLPYPHEDA